ncbi:superoxide dismutase, Fe-Mn family, partial [Lecanoromycetidae sp. Uapishka_2]
MILSNTLRQQTALRTCRTSMLTHCLYNPKSQRRRLHRVAQLTHDNHFGEHGVGKMLTPSSYDYAWTEYQGYIVQRLNSMTADTKDDKRPTKDILIEYARNPAFASLFNHASMAWNNHCFFSTLSPNPAPMSPFLTEKINRSFSSVESLRETFIATANAMFGPGFVWLVKRNTVRASGAQDLPELAILTTYLAGSPWPQAHYRAQESDTNTNLQAGAWGAKSGKAEKIAPGGTNIHIMMCVNTWQHVWLRDYGFGGKKRFLANWWDTIDWDVVERNAEFEAPRDPQKPAFNLKRAI